jgi:hypothetical protein
LSRLTSLSPAALRAVFSPDADDDLLILLTIYDPFNEDQVVYRLADGYTKRLSENAAEVTYGVTSNTQDFTFLPMQISLPSEDEAQAPRCSIVMYDVTRFLTPIIRTLTAPPRIKLELVLSKSPDVVEVSFSDFYITGFTYNADTVTAELSMIDYEREPFPGNSFTPRWFPGMF